MSTERREFEDAVSAVSEGTSVTHVFEQGRYDGRSLREWPPDVLAKIVTSVDPTEVILFGSLARGEEGPGSDIDLLIVVDRIARSEKPELTTTAN